ncbi:MAG: hypothetical protein K6G61_09295 [Solobacterium sp.]|nr:hypothetical protein [Solobacterium sp.]
MGITLSKLFSDLRFVKLRGNENKRKYLLRFLPDIYDKAKTPSDVYEYEQNSIEKELSDLFNGNGSGEGRETRASEFSKSLLKDLMEDRFVQYRYDCSPKTVTDSMLDNISTALVSREHTAASLRQFIVSHYGIDDVYGNTGMHDALCRLAEANTFSCLCYGVFLLFLCSVYHVESWKLKYLYSGEKIESLTAQEVKVSRKINDHFKPFDDPGYMGSYHVYTRDLATERLMPFARIVIGPGQAVLELTSNKMVRKDNELDRYTCTPVLCRVSGLVYMIFENKNGIVKIVIFQYEPFVSEPMYLRTAVCISSRARHRFPVITKMIICAGELSGKRLKYACGHLKMNAYDLLLNEDSYRGFREEFKHEPWMPQFLSYFEEKIMASEEKYYVIPEISVLNAPGTGIGPDDKIRILEGLKYFSREREYIPADTPDRLFSVLLKDTERTK